MPKSPDPQKKSTKKRTPRKNSKKKSPPKLNVVGSENGFTSEDYSWPEVARDLAFNVMGVFMRTLERQQEKSPTYTDSLDKKFQVEKDTPLDNIIELADTSISKWSGFTIIVSSLFSIENMLGTHTIYFLGVLQRYIDENMHDCPAEMRTSAQLINRTVAQAIHHLEQQDFPDWVVNSLSQSSG